MWANKNDHACKNECDYFLIIYTQKGFFLENIQIRQFFCVLLSSLVFTSRKKNHEYFRKKTNPCHLPLPFPTKAPLLPLPLQNRWTMSMDNVGLKIFILKTSNSMVTLTFVPWCKLKWSL